MVTALPDPLGRVLDLARWAPSGDNTQPWRFEVLRPDHVAVHAFDTRRYCVYDVDGRPSQMSVGALLENIRIASSAFSLKACVARRTDCPEERPVFDVRLKRDPLIAKDPLADYIRKRVVQRKPMSTRRLSEADKRAMENAVAPGYRLVWLETWHRRWAVAKLLFCNGKIRLTMPEAYSVHRDVIQWNARFSEDRIPDQALGVGRWSLLMMRHAMKSWERVELLNKYFGGTLLPRIEMDLVPALACAAHVAVLAPQVSATIDDFVRAGAIMQRLWLTATSRGLFLQPQLTPIVFSRYVEQGRRFSRVTHLWDAAGRVARTFAALVGAEAAGPALFFARIGTGPAPESRSTRLSLDRLMHRPDAP